MDVQNVCQKIEESFANGTNDREAHPKFWIAALVQVNCEKKTATRLGKAGYDTYIPTQQEIHQWSDRKKKWIVLFCQWLYLFVQQKLRRNGYAINHMSISCWLCLAVMRLKENLPRQFLTIKLKG